MMRVPFFVFTNMQNALLFSRWVQDHVHELRQTVKQVSRHAELMDVEPHLMGKVVHVWFRYATGDAAGQNMTTTCTWHACLWLMSQMQYFENMELENFGVEGSMSGDKKVTYQSFIGGRGIRVTAECFINREILKKILKVTPEQIMHGHHLSMAASQQVGMIGYNINVANVIASIFTATGQDIACVHECSLAQLHVQDIDDGLYVNILLPSLIVGTVGGGTHLPRQNDYLKMLDCAGPGKVSRLAEIIAGFCLALDLSTMCAVAGGQFASAHERLGRNRPVQWFRKEDLSPIFFQSVMREALDESKLLCDAVEPIHLEKKGSSIITELSAQNIRKLLGHFCLRVTYRKDSGASPEKADLMAKVKPLDKEIIHLANRMATMCGDRLAAAYKKFQKYNMLTGCHIREMALYSEKDSRFTRHVPKVYGLYRNDKREAYVLVLERLTDESMLLLDSVDEVPAWEKEHIEIALKDVAEIHAIWYGREEELVRKPWLSPVLTTERMEEMAELWDILGVHASEEFPEWMTQEDLALHRRLIHDLPDWYPHFDGLPKTLIHNDFNPRNLCLRKGTDGLRLCLYDWELATLHAPQHDLAEFLCFVLTPEATAEEVQHFLEFHRLALEEAVGRSIDPEAWRLGFHASLYDLAINRFAQYIMAHTFRHYDFMERIIRTMRHLIHLAGKY
jgi:hypothetical protein